MQLIEFDTKILDIIQRTPKVKSFRLQAREDISFLAGQFFCLTIQIKAKAVSKYFSFSNSPTEKGYLEFTKRITQSEFSQCLDKVRIGDLARVKMPYGLFTLSTEGRKIAFLSGGIGITPIRSMCKFATDERLASDIVLVYGNNRKEDIIFREDFDRMSLTNQRFRVIYTLTFPEIDKQNWPGRIGYIDQIMIKQEINDYREWTFYVCGPPNMVSNLTEMLKENLNIPQQQVKTENFSGY